MYTDTMDETALVIYDALNIEARRKKLQIDRLCLEEDQLCYERDLLEFRRKELVQYKQQNFDHLLAAVEIASNTTQSENDGKEETVCRVVPNFDDALIGKRVSVYWSGMGKSYNGVVSDTRKSVQVFVKYDDGEEAWETDWSDEIKKTQTVLNTTIAFKPCWRSDKCSKHCGHRGNCDKKKKKEDTTTCVTSMHTHTKKPDVVLVRPGKRPRNPTSLLECGQDGSRNLKSVKFANHVNEFL